MTAYTPEQTIYSNSPELMRELVEGIKQIHDISQRAQAEALGVGWTTMRNWLNGTAAWPKSAQVALEGWLAAPVDKADEQVCLACWSEPTLDERVKLAALWRTFNVGESFEGIKDWTAEQLRQYAEGWSAAPWFRDYVDAMTVAVDDEGELFGGIVESGLSASAKSVIYRLAHEACQPHVIRRLLELLGDD